MPSKILNIIQVISTGALAIGYLWEYISLSNLSSIIDASRYLLLRLVNVVESAIRSHYQNVK